MRDKNDLFKMDDNANDSEDDFVMSFTPRQAQTCGGQSIFFTFSGKVSPIQETSFYFVIFEGSDLRHITSAKVINPYTLQAVIPEHNLSESTMMSVCHSRSGTPLVVATDKFSFTLDSTYLLAQSLAMNSLNGFALSQLEELYQNFLNAETEDLKAMDHRLTSSFKQLNLPKSWRLSPPLVEDINANSSGWTLLHFCAKFDLVKLAEHLIEKPGASEAVHLLSDDGLTPVDTAKVLGNESVMEVLTRVPSEEKITDRPNTKTGCPSVKGHKLGTTTITNCNSGGQQALEEDVRLLEELHSLANETKKGKIEQNLLSDNEEGDGMESDSENGPLATSLLKLKKINQEIQRLRDLSSENGDERRERTVSCPNSFRFFGFNKENGYPLPGNTLRAENGNEELSTLSEDEMEDMELCSGRDTARLITPNVSLTSIDDNELDEDDSESAVKAPESHEASSGEEMRGDKGLEEEVNKDKASKDEEKKTNVASDGLNGVNGNNDKENVLEEERATELDTVSGKDEEIGTTEGEIKEGKAREEQEDENIIKGSKKVSVDGEESEIFSKCIEEVEEAPVSTKEAGNENLLDSEPDSSDDENKADLADTEESQDEELAEDSEIRGLASVAEETEEELEQMELDKEQAKKRLEEVNLREKQAEAMTTKNKLEVKAEGITCQPKADIGIIVEKEKIHQSIDSFEERISSHHQVLLKKERPLSDSLENLRSVEKEIDLMNLAGHKSKSGFGLLNKLKSRSLDALFPGGDKEKSIKTSSQVSLDRSAVSLVSEPDSPETTRSNSVSRESRHSHETSQLSLNDVCCSFSSQEDEVVSEKKGFPFKFNFKKAKSLTNLEMKKNRKQEEDDRRKTIMGGICVESAAMRRTQEMENHTEIRKPVTVEDQRGVFVLARYNTHYKEDVSRSELVVTVQPPKFERSRTASEIIRRTALENEMDTEVDTDEGTSSVIENKIFQEKDKKTDKDKRFHLLRSKHKKKVKEKEKEKDKKEKDVEKGNKKEVLKKVQKANNSGRSEGKSSFLGKRGSSFRQSLRSVPSPIPSHQEQKMFQRASSIGPTSSAAIKHTTSLQTLRHSENISPTQFKRPNVADPDGQMEAGSLPNLNAIGVPGSSIGADPFAAEDIQDGNIGERVLEYDSDLDIKDEPETWSEFVDKKVQRKMHAKDIKRQDVIYELILTESNYVRTLNIMYKIYYLGMVAELPLDHHKLDQIFPKLEDLLEINGKFLCELKSRQQSSDNYVIELIGDILVDRWGGENGELIKDVYGYFCSRHLQAVALYKELVKTDKNFANFIKACMINERTRRLSIPECITLVTQRLTKYPLLIQAIIKATKESKADHANLTKALKYIKRILTGVDDYVREYEKEMRLEEIRKRLDPKGEVQLKSSNKIYKAVKLFPKRARLCYDGNVTWRGKSKSVETMAVLLNSRLIFLQEKDNSKYTVLSVDQNSPVVSLKNLMVREKATDNKALFLVSTSTEGPVLYEMGFSSSRERNCWMEMLTGAVKNCPQEEEENLSDLEEEVRKEEEAKAAKLKEVVEQLNHLNVNISSLIAEKNKVVAELREMLEKYESSSGRPPSGIEMKQADVLNARETLNLAVNEVTTLTSIICGYDPPPVTPSPSPTTPLINSNTKRAETFGGFDRQVTKAIPAVNVSRARSMAQDLKVTPKPSVTSEVDSSLFTKDLKNIRKTSQGGSRLAVLGRTKTMGSQEDLASLGTSNSPTVSTTSLSPQLASLAQLQDQLMLLVEVTNKQDLEVASVRLTLQETRNELSRVRSEKTELEEKLTHQQKEHEKMIKIEKEHYEKLQREFKRVQRKFLERNVTEHNSDAQRAARGSSGNGKGISGKHRLSRTKGTGDRSNSGDTSHEPFEPQNVIYF